MAHFAKFTASASGHISAHCSRQQVEIVIVSEDTGELETVKEYVKFGNQSIDLSRTHLNYNLAPDRGVSGVEYMQERLSQVKVQKRADVNVLCSWVMTLPQEENVIYTEKQTREYFEFCYSFLVDKYGEQNVVSSYVHMDETTPHMHFAFIPVVPDVKWNEKHPEAPREKVSAKECVTRNDLNEFHLELKQALDDRFGFDFYPVLNGSTLGGNLKVTELKAVKEINEICGDLTVLQAELENASEELKRVENDIQSLEQEKISLAVDLEALEEEKNLLQTACQKLEDKGKALSMDEWEMVIAQARVEQQQQKEKSLLASFAEKLIAEFPAVRNLWFKFLEDSRANKSRKRENKKETLL